MSNQPYLAAALAGELDKLRNAAPGTINDTLIAVACRVYTLANAGALTEAEADQQLADIARSRGHAEQSIKDTLKSAKRRVGSTAATIPEPTYASTKTAPKHYNNLAEYEQERGAPGAYAAAGWKATQQSGRPALRFASETGMPRYRFLDGNAPKYWHAIGHHTDENKTFYRLDAAFALAQVTPQPLVLCNGESSVVAAQAHGVAATCITGGGERVLPPRLLDELLAAWPGAFVVALDCDGKGRKAAPELAQQLRDAGRQAHAVDLQLGEREDLADFCALRNGTSIAALQSLPELIALAPTTTQSTTPTTQLLHASALSTLPPTTWLVDGVIATNKLSQLFAPPASGKSFVSLDIALCVAQFAPVVYVAAEAVEDYQDRAAAWCKHHNLPLGQLYFWREPVQLASASAVDALIATVAPLHPALVIVDPLASCLVGLEESSTGDMTRAVDALNHIRTATGAGVLIVHHTGWSDEHERGSSVLRAACRVVMKLSTSDDGLMTLTCAKANNGKPFEARHFRLASVESSAVPVPANKLTTRDAPLSERQMQVLEALDLAHFRSGASFTQLHEHTSIAKGTLNKAIDKLIARGLIAFQGARNKQYYLTDDGDLVLGEYQQQTITGGLPVVHHTGELEVNWMVNKNELPGEQRTDQTLPDANVHGEQGVNLDLQNSPPDVENCSPATPHCDAVVHPSSPLVHHEFTTQVHCSVHPPSP